MRGLGFIGGIHRGVDAENVVKGEHKSSWACCCMECGGSLGFSSTSSPS